MVKGLEQKLLMLKNNKNKNKSAHIATGQQQKDYQQVFTNVQNVVPNLPEKHTSSGNNYDYLQMLQMWKRNKIR